VKAKGKLQESACLPRLALPFSLQRLVYLAPKDCLRSPLEVLIEGEGVATGLGAYTSLRVLADTLLEEVSLALQEREEKEKRKSKERRR
jgi:hypothetical protein